MCVNGEKASLIAMGSREIEKREFGKLFHSFMKFVQGMREMERWLEGYVGMGKKVFF